MKARVVSEAWRTGQALELFAVLGIARETVEGRLSSNAAVKWFMHAAAWCSRPLC